MMVISFLLKVFTHSAFYVGSDVDPALLTISAYKEYGHAG
jgi:hypothetical protein